MVPERGIGGLSPIWWIALAVLGIVAIAYILGLHPAAPATAPASRIQSGVVLLPGETLIAPPDAITPAPAAAPPAPAVPQPANKPGPAPTTPRYGKPAPPVVARQSPATPPQSPRRANSYDRSTRSVCVNCGKVVGMRQGESHWEVRVLYHDGTRETLRFSHRPPVEIDDAVHLENGVLFKD